VRQNNIHFSGVPGFPVDIRRSGVGTNNIAKIMFEGVHAIISEGPHAVTQRHCRLQYCDVGQLLQSCGNRICTQAWQAKCNAECLRILRDLGAKVDILAEPRMTRPLHDAKVVSQEPAVDICTGVRGCFKSRHGVEWQNLQQWRSMNSRMRCPGWRARERSLPRASCYCAKTAAHSGCL